MPKLRTIPAGTRFGRWTTTGEMGRIHIQAQGRDRIHWRCVCDCGTDRYVASNLLVRGESQSCGCLQKDNQRAAVTKHGDAVHYLKVGQVYRAWNHMRQRCNNPRCDLYPNYGGRGIDICQECNDYKTFRDWSLGNGFEPGLSIDRIDNDGGYSPDNCRWTTSSVQVNNRRNTRYLTAFGETKALTEWSRDVRCKVSYPGLCARLAHGLAPEDAITRDSQKGKSLDTPNN